MNDPRTRGRIAMVLHYFENAEASQHAIDLRAVTIRKLFGNKHMPNTLAEWLFANMLMQVKSYIVGEYTKAYRVRRAGYRKLKKLMEDTRTPDNIEAERRRFLVLDNDGLLALFGMARNGQQ